MTEEPWGLPPSLGSAGDICRQRGCAAGGSRRNAACWRGFLPHTAINAARSIRQPRRAGTFSDRAAGVSPRRGRPQNPHAQIFWGAAARCWLSPSRVPRQLPTGCRSWSSGLIISEPCSPAAGCGRAVFTKKDTVLWPMASCHQQEECPWLMAWDGGARGLQFWQRTWGTTMGRDS